MALFFHSLVLNLEVEVSREPVVEEPGLDVCRGDGLRRHPVLVPLLVDLHRDVRHLSDEGEPEALQRPAM